MPAVPGLRILELTATMIQPAPPQAQGVPQMAWNVAMRTTLLNPTLTGSV